MCIILASTAYTLNQIPFDCFKNENKYCQLQQCNCIELFKGKLSEPVVSSLD